MFKKLVGIVLLLIFLAAGIVVFAFFTPAGQRVLPQFSGARTDLTTYIGRQIVGIVNRRLVPQLEFGELVYDAPFTVTMTDVRLRADSEFSVLEVPRLVVTLAEIPERGKPIVIQNVRIDGGRVNLQQLPEGGFRGLDPIVREDGEKAETESGFRLSDVLELRLVEVRDFAVSYDDGSGGEPLTIEDITTQLEIEEAREAGADGAPGGPGWYMLDFEGGRAPGLQLDVDGRLNIDSLEVWLGQTLIALTLDERTLASLPGQVREAVAQYEPRGAVRLRASGTLPLEDPLAAALTASLEGSDMYVRFEEYQIPVESINAQVSVENGRANLTDTVIRALRGQITANGRFHLRDEQKLGTVLWEVEGLDLQTALATRTEGEPPKLAGVLRSSGSAQLELQDPMNTLNGSGTVQIEHGRFVAIPVISDLAEALRVASRFGREAEFNHRLEAAFNIFPGGLGWERDPSAGDGAAAEGDRPPGIDITSAEVVTGVFAARASGPIWFDGELSLKANAGPLEGVQARLGRIGDVFGSITDRLATYWIYNTVDDPMISARPLGIGQRPRGAAERDQAGEEENRGPLRRIFNR